jgi:hypothetical protein
VDREGVEPSSHRLILPQLPPRRGCFAELSAIRPMDPGQGVEPRSPRSERGVLPLDDPGKGGRSTAWSARRSVEEGDVLHRARALLGLPRDPVPAVQHRRAEAAPLRPSPAWEIDAAGERLVGGAVVASSVRPPEARRCFLCHSPTLRPWITDRRLSTFASGRRPTWRSFGARTSRVV